MHFKPMCVLNVCFSCIWLSSQVVTATKSIERCTYFFFAFYICFDLEKFKKYFKDFVGIYSAKHHATSVVHLGETRGLKGLLHYTKCNHNTYESEIGSKFSFSFVCSRPSKR